MFSIVNILKSKVFKNSAWQISEQIFQMLVSLIVGVLTARYLGPSNYGAINYTASFVSFFFSVATLGMEGVIIKKIIDQPNEDGKYLGGCIGLRFCSSIICSISIVIVVCILNPGDKIKLCLVLLQSLQLVFKSFQIIDSWFQRHLLSKYTSIGKMIACVVVAVYKVFLLVTGKSIYWFALSNSLTDLLISVMLIIFYKRQCENAMKITIKKGMEVLSESYHFILSGIMVAIYGQMDRIMIGNILNDSEVGLYTIATLLCGMWIFVPTAVINSFRAPIMEIKKNGDERLYLQRLRQVYALVIWLCIIAAIFFSIFSKFIVNILYGAEYMGAVESMKIYIWSELFSMIGTARGIWILCENKNKYVKYYLIYGVIVNLILNTILIPWFGAPGAAVATLVTQITTSLIAPLFYKETRRHTLIVIQAFFLQFSR